tara:strand:- start:1116 stop:1388 length:273 start_codon:yes stop_codon:yes gene_type:complete
MGTYSLTVNLAWLKRKTRLRIRRTQREREAMDALAKKRATYLSFFKDGVADALFHGRMDDTKRSSAYYKQGYDFGLHLWNEQQEEEPTKQ